MRRVGHSVRTAGVPPASAHTNETRSAGVPPASRLRRVPAGEGWRTRGYLPHFDAAEHVQHIVFRLADSLPAELHQRIAKAQSDEFGLVLDAALDQGHGSHNLAVPQIAELVQTALLRFDSERYRLIAWCVMPNHVHVLAELKTGTRLDAVVHSWKSYTAKQANRLLERNGSFWAPEYFDRFMRDEEHVARTAVYIEANPVKAGLCANICDWPYSSAWQGWGGRDARGPDLQQ